MKHNIWETLKSMDNAGINFAQIAAGFFGALGSLIWGDEKYSKRRIIGILLMGTIAPIFLVPILTFWLNFPEILVPSMSFLVGLTIMRLSDKILDFIKELDIKTLLNIIFKKKL